MVHAVIERIRPGEVLVVAMPEPRPIALVGALLATQAQVRGAAAILIDGAVRDVEELRQLGLPVWTRFVRAAGANKTQVGELGVALTVGGAQIGPGDVVVLDADGGVCVPQRRAGEVLAAAEARSEREARLREQFLSGALSYDLHRLRGQVEKGDSK
jgi:4-hydroxy-4-methyl-2-oxoglutarate aldolase